MFNNVFKNPKQINSNSGVSVKLFSTLNLIDLNIGYGRTHWKLLSVGYKISIFNHFNKKNNPTN